MDWSTGLLVQLTPSSQQEVWVLGNLFVLMGRSQPAIRGMRGRSGKSYVWRLFHGGHWRYLPIRYHDNRDFADWIRLCSGLSKIQKTGTAVQSLTRLPVVVEAVGRAVSIETETINRNMDSITMKLTACKWKLILSGTRMDRETAVKVCRCSPQRQNNQSYLFWLPRTSRPAGHAG